VIAIGQRVFVNCAENGGSEPLFLGDETGKVISTQRVADGVEVEVIAWRPRGANETRYRVRVLSTGADGWLSADNLRKLLGPPREEKLAAGDGDGPPPPRFNTGRSPSSPATDEPDAHADDRGRRFGQRP